MKYYCSQCGLAVIILPDNDPIKACKCEASIIAEATAHASGSGNMKG